MRDNHKLSCLILLVFDLFCVGLKEIGLNLNTITKLKLEGGWIEVPHCCNYNDAQISMLLLPTILDKVIYPMNLTLNFSTNPCIIKKLIPYIIDQKFQIHKFHIQNLQHTSRLTNISSSIIFHF